jgi:hypothetical protein
MSSVKKKYFYLCMYVYVRMTRGNFSNLQVAASFL